VATPVSIQLYTLRASEAGSHVQLSTTCERPVALPEGLPDDAFGD
jgi:hypothetical protein